MNGTTQRCPHCGRAGWQFAYRSDPSTPVDLHTRPTLTEEGRTLHYQPQVNWRELVAICSNCRQVLTMQ